MNTQEFNRVLICNIRKRDTRIPVKTEEEYMKELKINESVTSDSTLDLQLSKTIAC